MGFYAQRFRQRGCVLDRGGPFTLCVLDRGGPFTLCVLDRGGAYGRHVVLLTELWCFYTMRCASEEVRQYHMIHVRMQLMPKGM